MFEIKGDLGSKSGTTITVNGQELRDVICIVFEHEVHYAPVLVVEQLDRNDQGALVLEEDLKVTDSSGTKVYGTQRIRINVTRFESNGQSSHYKP